MKEDTNVLSSVCFEMNCACYSVLSEEHKAFVSPTTQYSQKAETTSTVQPETNACEKIRRRQFQPKTHYSGIIIDNDYRVNESLFDACAVGKACPGSVSDTPSLRTLRTEDSAAEVMSEIYYNSSDIPACIVIEHIIKVSY